MKCRILVAEDSATQAEALLALLAEAGHEVTLARSGEEALRTLGAGKFDLVLSDVVMPGITGYELCRRIKDDPGLRAVPVVLLTSRTDPMDIVRGLEAGADNYITKPYDPEHLLARVSHVLNNRRLRRSYRTSMGVTVSFLGSELNINSEKEQILDLLLSSVEDVIRTNRALEESRRHLEEAHSQLQEYARERAAEARASTERYRTLMQHAADAIFVLRPDGTVTEANARAAELLGRPVEELVGTALGQFAEPEHRGRLSDSLAGPQGRRLPPQTEYALTRPDGSRVWCEVTASRVEVGSEALVLAIFRDVTERRQAEERLRRSERRLAEAQSIARVGSWEWEVESGAVEWSQEMHVLAGEGTGFDGTFDGAIGCIHPDDRAGVVATLQEALRTGVSWEQRLRTRAGRVLHARAEVVKDATGRPVRVLGSAQDITERTEAEHRLEESEERYRSLFQYNPDAVFSVAPDGTFTSANPACSTLTGYEPGELIGRSFQPLVVPEDLERTLRHFRAALAGEPQSYQIGALARDGRRLQLSITNTPIVVGGQVAGVFGIAEDVTAREEAQEALRRSEETFRALVDAAPVAILLLDRDGCIRMWNPAACRIFGWSAEEVIGSSLPFIPEENAEESRVLFERLLRGETLESVELLRRRRDGAPVDVTLSSAPLRGPGGEVVGFIAVLADVTERRRSEQALRQSEAQLRQSQKMEAVGQLAAGVAHDFNNLLTVIKGNTQLILADVDATDPLRDDLEEIDESVDRAAALTRQLLAFGRKQVLAPQVLDVNEVVRKAERLLGRVLRANLRLEAELEPRAGCVEADPGQMEQILVNLAVNARDAMPQGGRLTIRTRHARVEQAPRDLPELAPGDYVVLTVSDSGLGMPPEVQARVFEPFFTTKPAGQGTGLGLSTAYGIVRQSGGQIRVESVPGEGTTFEIYLPRVPGEATGGAEPPSPAPRGAASGNVLLVEDEAAVRSVTRRMLERFGYRVEVAENGEEALRLLATHPGPLDLLITDVVMPGRGGQEVLARARERFPQIRVLVISGYTAEAAPLRDGADPGVEFIQKPFSPEALTARVTQMLEARGRT